MDESHQKQVGELNQELIEVKVVNIHALYMISCGRDLECNHCKSLLSTGTVQHAAEQQHLRSGGVQAAAAAGSPTLGAPSHSDLGGEAAETGVGAGPDQAGPGGVAVPEHRAGEETRGRVLQQSLNQRQLSWSRQKEDLSP